MAKKNSALITSILYIVVGVLLAIFQSKTLGWAMTLVGVFFIVSGVLDVLKKNYTSGAISLIIGIAIIVLGWLMVEIVLLVLGILIAIKGGLAFVEVLKRDKKNAIDLVFPVLTMLIGLILAFGNGLNIIILIVGILLAVDGVLGLMSALKK